MSQGQINVQPLMPATIDGIAKALKAVSDVYGIDVSKQQARLAELDAQAKEASLPELKSKSALYAASYGRELDRQNNPNSPQGQAPGFRAPEILANEKAQKESAKLDLENKKLQGEIDAQPGKAAAEANVPFVTASNAFKDVAKDNMEALEFSRLGREMLGKKGVVLGNAATDLAIKAQGVISKIGTATSAEYLEAKSRIDKAKEKAIQFASNDLTISQRNDVADIFDAVDKVNTQSIKNKALGIAAIHSPGIPKMTEAQLADKLFKSFTAGGGAQKAHDPHSVYERYLKNYNNPKAKE